MTRHRRHQQHAEAGFTMVELMVVLIIIAILFAVSTVNLGRPQVEASLNTTVDTLVSDLKSQQLLAMDGDSGSKSSQQPHGVRIDSTSYDLFSDSSYSGSDPDNFNIDAGNGISLSTNFPTNQVVFDTGDGTVSGYVPGNNTITVDGSGVSKTLTIDRFGAITVH